MRLQTILIVLLAWLGVGCGGLSAAHGQLFDTADQHDPDPDPSDPPDDEEEEEEEEPTAPAGWTCDPATYDAGDGCHCACGVYDPDCDQGFGQLYNCAFGDTCNAEGECEGPGGPPASWTCNPNFYDAGDGCDCGCGAYDPDCAIPGATVHGCASGETCDAAGECESSGPSVPSSWTCPPSFYDAGDGCDCGCGAYDPDCAIPGATVYGCASGEICDAAGECESSGPSVPSSWTCLPSHYDTGDGCDCGCGAYDPDCAIPGAIVYGCASGETCDAAGECVGSPPTSYNLGFEEWVSDGSGGWAPVGWTLGTELLIDRDSTQVHSGSWSAFLMRGSGDPAANEIRSELIPVTAGASYHIDLWVLDPSPEARARHIYHWFKADETQVAVAEYGVYSSDSDDWQLLRREVTAPAGAAYVQVKTRVYGDEAGVVHLDSVAVTPLP